MKKLLLIACIALLTACSDEDNAKLDKVMNTPAREMTFGDLVIIVVVGALIARSSHTCNCNKK